MKTVSQRMIIWEYSLSLRLCLAGLLQACLRLWITVWCQPSSPQGLVGDEVEGQQRSGLRSPCTCACTSLHLKVRAGLAITTIFKHAGKWNVAYQGLCWTRQPKGGAGCTPARTCVWFWTRVRSWTRVLLWFCRQPSSIFPFVGLRTPRLSRGREGWRKGQRGSSRLSPEGESWGGIAEWQRRGSIPPEPLPNQNKQTERSSDLIWADQSPPNRRPGATTKLDADFSCSSAQFRRTVPANVAFLL